MTSGAAYYGKWLAYGVAIGAIAGASALLLHYAVAAVSRASGLIAGWAPWSRPLIAALGVFLSGLLAYAFVGGGEELSINAMIERYHKRRGEVEGRVPVLGWLASALDIGLGGPVGSEAPMAAMSGGFTSLVAGRLGLRGKDKRVAFAAALGAGIGAILKAPLGGALLSAEILYRRDAEWSVVYPALVASVVGWLVYSSAVGFGPLLGRHDSPVGPYELPLFVLLGAAAGLLARLYVYVLHGLQKAFRSLRINNYFKPAIGGLAAGLIGLLAPQVLGEGIGYMGQALSDGLKAPPIVLAVLPVLKVAATSLAVGSGGVGGVFVPGLAAGSFLGLDVGLLLHALLPTLVVDVAPFVVAGMAAMFGAASRAPLAVAVMAVEMTGDISALPAVLVAVAASCAVAGDIAIFPAQPPRRQRA
ncbi:MAG: chloride channel protein [Thermoproteus sp.]